MDEHGYRAWSMAARRALPGEVWTYHYSCEDHGRYDLWAAGTVTAAEGSGTLASLGEWALDPDLFLPARCHLELFEGDALPPTTISPDGAESVQEALGHGPLLGVERVRLRLVYLNLPDFVEVVEGPARRREGSPGWDVGGKYLDPHWTTTGKLALP